MFRCPCKDDRVRRSEKPTKNTKYKIQIISRDLRILSGNNVLFSINQMTRITDYEQNTSESFHRNVRYVGLCADEGPFCETTRNNTAYSYGRKKGDIKVKGTSVFPGTSFRIPIPVFYVCVCVCVCVCVRARARARVSIPSIRYSLIYFFETNSVYDTCF